jgi:hypothetical protein
MDMIHMRPGTSTTLNKGRGRNSVAARTGLKPSATEKRYLNQDSVFNSVAMGHEIESEAVRKIDVESSYAAKRAGATTKASIQENTVAQDLVTQTAGSVNDNLMSPPKTGKHKRAKTEMH